MVLTVPYVFCVDLRTNSDIFLEQHKQIGFFITQV